MTVISSWDVCCKNSKKRINQHKQPSENNEQKLGALGYEQARSWLKNEAGRTC